MESIAEVVIVSVKRQCSSCNVMKGDDQFVKCVGNCSFFKTCQICRDHKKKYRDKAKASKVKVVDDTISVSSSSTTTPADYFGPVPSSLKVHESRRVRILYCLTYDIYHNSLLNNPFPLRC